MLRQLKLLHKHCHGVRSVDLPVAYLRLLHILHIHKSETFVTLLQVLEISSTPRMFLTRGSFPNVGLTGKREAQPGPLAEEPVRNRLGTAMHA